MNWGVEREVKKETPSGQLLDPLTNSVQMVEESAWVMERAGQVMVITTNVEMERRTASQFHLARVKRRTAKIINP